MECFWYLIAGLGAGVGTGLAGLSAATVMVPILIVLCPSFAGETGAYQATAIASVVIAAVLYLLLRLLEKEPWYWKLFVQKEPGEVCKSLLMLFLMFAVVIAVVWGIFGKPYIAATAIIMWGTGDASAALIGIPFGKHIVHLKGTDGKKSWEGSAAMFAVAFVCGFCVLFFGQGMPVLFAILASALAAFFGTATELFTPGKYDTVTVPVTIAAVLLFLGLLFP